MKSEGIGQYHSLEVLREVDFGVYLDGGEIGEILLPGRYVPDGTETGDFLDVFLYLDSEDRLIATTEKPYATVGEFARLRAVAVNQTGAFLDWGLGKDLLVPYREQREPMYSGRSYVVYVYLDPTSLRIVASTKLRKFLSPDKPEYAHREQVQLRVWKASDLGYDVLINDRHEGVLYRNEIFRKLAIGKTYTGYIKKVRDDHKIDCSLQAPVADRMDPVGQQILDALNEAGGKLPYTDKSPPEAIYRKFGCSKRDFKMALGRLYKQKRVVLEGHVTRLANDNS